MLGIVVDHVSVFAMPWIPRSRRQFVNIQLAPLQESMARGTAPRRVRYFPSNFARIAAICASRLRLRSSVGGGAAFAREAAGPDPNSRELAAARKTRRSMAPLQYNSDAKQWSSNIRFNFIHRPLSDIYVVYTEERPTLSSAHTNKLLTLKYTHLIAF